MELLEFARGPALQFAIAVFVFGVLFRIFSLFLMFRTRDASEGSSREQPAAIAAFREIIIRLWPRSAYKERTLFALLNGYLMHIGLALVVFFLLPHILFFEGLFGFSWPSLPNNVIFGVAMITIASMIAALVIRITNPVQRIISTFDDYFSWFVTFLPLATGVAAATLPFIIFSPPPFPPSFLVLCVVNS